MGERIPGVDLRVLHLILGMRGGGAERQLAFLARELDRRGHDVHVGYVYGGVHSEGLAASGCTLHRFAAAARSKVLLPPQVLALAVRLRPDVLHTWLTHLDIVGGAAACMLRIPWVMSERSAALNYPPSLLNRARLAIGRHADLIVPNSEGGAEYWTGHGVEPARLEIVPNFVPLADIAAAERVEDGRLSDDDELVLHVGRLSPEKNLELLVDALRPTFRARPRARFAFCGDGPLLADLSARVEEAGLRERVIFAGFVPNVASWLKRASALVAVSRWEGHPNAVLEAMAAGVPIVASDIPAYRSVLGEQSAAFVGGEDAEAIAAAIVRTLEDRPAAEARAARARLALESQSLEAIAARYEAAYRHVLRATGAS